jgi:hypothetical protein
MCCCKYDSIGNKYYFALTSEEKIAKDQKTLKKCEQLIRNLLHSRDKNYSEKMNKLYEKKRELEHRIAFNKAFGDIGKFFVEI